MRYIVRENKPIAPEAKVSVILTQKVYQLMRAGHTPVREISREIGRGQP